MHNFPFVVVDVNMAAQELHTRNPYLFRVIMFVATTLPPARKQAMKTNILAYLGHRLLVNEERNLDLLQGLLVFIAWADLSFYRDKQITHLTYLATGYACNLGLTHMPHTSTEDTSDASEAILPWEKSLLLESQKAHDVDEQRAFLGCYYLQSIDSVQFRRQNSLKSPYVETCYKCLAQLDEVYTDSALEKLIRMQQIMDKITERYYVGKSSHEGQSSKYLPADEMRQLRVELDDVEAGVDRLQPFFLSTWLHYNYALVKLYEPATYLEDQPGDTSSFRGQCLVYCLQAAKSFFTTFLSFPAESLLYSPFVTFAELVSAIATASRVLLLEADGWSVEEARQTLNLSAVLADIIKHFEAVDRLEKQWQIQHSNNAENDHGTGAANDVTVWEDYIEKLSFVRTWFEARIGTPGPFVPMEAGSEEFPGEF